MPKSSSNRASVAWVACVAAGLSISPIAMAQTARTVDQAVEDVDPLAASQRVIDAGNAQFPTRSMIVERVHRSTWSRVGLPALDSVTGLPTDARPYEYRAPGVTARMDRPEYLVMDLEGNPATNRVPVFDGAFLEVTPPNVVYQLTPEAPKPIDPAVLYPNWQDSRIDGRVGRRATPQLPSVTQTVPSTTTRSLKTAPDGKRYTIRRIHTKRYNADDEASESSSKPSVKKPAETEKSAAQEPSEEAEKPQPRKRD